MAEGAAIVASILLAFAIDAWWDERQDRAEEAVLLSRLLEEFSTNIDRMDESMWRIGVQASAEAYQLVDSALVHGKTSLDIPTLTLDRTLRAPTFEADTPILDGIIRSGRLELIENRAILAAVSEWERLLRDYSELAQRTRSNMDSRLIPALAKRGDIGAALAHRWGTNFTIAAVDPSVVTAIQIDTELKGLLAVRLENSGNTLQRFDRAREAAETLVEAIKIAESK